MYCDSGLYRSTALSLVQFVILFHLLFYLFFEPFFYSTHTALDKQIIRLCVDSFKTRLHDEVEKENGLTNTNIFSCFKKEE